MLLLAVAIFPPSVEQEKKSTAALSGMTKTLSFDNEMSHHWPICNYALNNE